MTSTPSFVNPDTILWPTLYDHSFTTLESYWLENCMLCNSGVVIHDNKDLKGLTNDTEFISLCQFAPYKVTHGQSYRHFMLVNYKCRVLITSKLLICMALEP